MKKNYCGQAKMKKKNRSASEVKNMLLHFLWNENTLENALVWLGPNISSQISNPLWVFGKG